MTAGADDHRRTGSRLGRDRGIHRAHDGDCRIPPPRAADRSRGRRDPHHLGPTSHRRGAPRARLRPSSAPTPGASGHTGRPLGLQHGHARLQPHPQPSCCRPRRRSRSLASVLRLPGLAGVFVPAGRFVVGGAGPRTECCRVWRQRFRWSHQHGLRRSRGSARAVCSGFTAAAAGHRRMSKGDGQASLGGKWYARAAGGLRRSRGFARLTRGRAGGTARPVGPGAFGDCLPQEVIPIDGEGSEIFFGGVRFDRYFSGDRRADAGRWRRARAASGSSRRTGQRTKSIGMDGQATVGSRGFITARFDAGRSHTTAITSRPAILGLTTGTRLHLELLAAPGQKATRMEPDARARPVHGRCRRRARRRWTASTSEHRTPVLPLFAPVSSSTEAAVRTCHMGCRPTTCSSCWLAARGDWSSLLRLPASLRACSAIYRIAAHDHGSAPAQPVVPGLELARVLLQGSRRCRRRTCGPLNGFCSPSASTASSVKRPCWPSGTSTWGSSRSTLGNRLQGSPGTVGHSLPLSYYRSGSSNMATSLLPQVGTALGRLNPTFGPWQSPAGLPDVHHRSDPGSWCHCCQTTQTARTSSPPRLYTNFGQVTVNGLDLGVNYAIGGGWQADVGYSWFDSDIHDPEAEGSAPERARPRRQRRREDHSSPNQRGHRFPMGTLLPLGRRVLRRRCRRTPAPAFPPLYRSATASALRWTSRNLFNDRHWETFGGALIPRRALVSLQDPWSRSP